MKYRPFGNLGWDVSAFGLGVEELSRPDSKAEGSADAVVAASTRTVREAIDAGVNYLDLGHPYDRASQESVARIWATAGRGWSPAEWSLRWAWNHEAIAAGICDARDPAELHECLAVAGEAEAAGLTVRDQLTIRRVPDAYQCRRPIDCTSRRPCLPCPQGAGDGSARLHARRAPRRAVRRLWAV